MAPPIEMIMQAGSLRYNIKRHLFQHVFCVIADKKLSTEIPTDEIVYQAVNKIRFQVDFLIIVMFESINIQSVIPRKWSSKRAIYTHMQTDLSELFSISPQLDWAQMCDMTRQKIPHSFIFDNCDSWINLCISRPIREPANSTNTSLLWKKWSGKEESLVIVNACIRAGCLYHPLGMQLFPGLCVHRATHFKV